MKARTASHVTNPDENARFAAVWPTSITGIELVVNVRKRTAKEALPTAHELASLISVECKITKAQISPRKPLARSCLLDDLWLISLAVASSHA